MSAQDCLPAGAGPSPARPDDPAAMPRTADRARPMRAGGRLAAGHSPDFVAVWRSVYSRVYGWRRHGRFAVVPSLLRRPVLAYLPGLSYTDLNPAEARDLAREAAGRAYNVRALSAPEGKPPPGTPAVFRIDLRAFDHDEAAIWKRGLNNAARKEVRHAREFPFSVSEETGPGAVEAFMAMLSVTCVRHGVPMGPRALFEALVDALDARILVVRDPQGEATASLLWFLDGALAWVPWSGTLRKRGAGDLLFWTLIREALNAGADVVDFGRSPVGGNSCRFKRKFGAVPVPVLWLSDRPTDVYRRHGLTRKLWGALPRVVTDAASPRLCRYLAEY